MTIASTAARPLHRWGRTARRLAPWAVVIGLVGCTPIAETLGLDAAPVDATVDAAPVDAAAAVTDPPSAQLAEGFVAPPLTDLSTLPLLQRLPSDTPAVVAFAPPIIWSARLDVQAIIDGFGRWGEALRTESRGALGVDLTDPVLWRRIWLDATAPVTAALLDLEPPTFAIGGRITQPEAIETLIYALYAGRHPLRRSRVADGTVIGRLDGRGAAYAWKGTELWVVFGDGLQRGAAFSEALSLLQPGATLAELPAVHAAIAGLNDPRMGLAVLNIPAIVERGLRTAAQDPRLDTLRAREDHQRRFDEFAGANRLMNDRLRLQTLDLALRPQNVGEQVLRAAFYPFGPAALGLDFEHRTLRLTAVQRLTPGSLPATVLRPGVSTTVDDLLDGQSVTRIGASFDPDVVMQLARALLLVADRGDVALFEARLRSLTGVDTRRDLLGSAGGGVELALNVDPSRFQEPVAPAETLHRIGAVARWSVTDADLLGRALDRIEKAFDQVAGAGARRFIVTLPGVPQIRVQLAEDALYAAFDAEPLNRVVVSAVEAAVEPPPTDAGLTEAAFAALSPGDGGLASDGDPAADAGVAGGAAEPNDGGQNAPAADSRPATDSRPAGDAALHLYLDPLRFAPMVDALIGPDALDGAAAAGSGRFDFEKRRAQAITRAFSSIEVRGVQARETLTVTLELSAASKGISAAVADIVRASLPPESHP